MIWRQIVLKWEIDRQGVGGWGRVGSMERRLEKRKCRKTMEKVYGW